MDNKKDFHLLISYTRIKEIGEDGKNSKTYLCFDKNLKKEIVVKELNENPNWKIEDYYTEARILNQMKHPNVVEIIIAGEQVISNNNGLEYIDKICLAMPYYKNGSLNDLLKKGNIPDKLKSSLVLNILHGLSSIHIKNLMHLDLKPDNILISDRNEALISDFGISQYLKKNISFEEEWMDYIKIHPLNKPSEIINLQHLKENKDYTRWIKGMKMHLLLAPPEIVYAKKPFLSRKTDIYHIGMLIYLIYTEQTLENFLEIYNTKRISESRINQYIERVKNGEWYIENPKIPKNVSLIIKKCLEIIPQDRYSSINEIQNDFNKI